MQKSPIPKSTAPNGQKWNTWGATKNLVAGVKPGICCFNFSPKGHGGKAGYLYLPFPVANRKTVAVGIRCCERHGKSTVAVVAGTWKDS